MCGYTVSSKRQSRMVYQMKIACGRSTDSPFGVAQVGPEGDATPSGDRMQQHENWIGKCAAYGRR